MEEALGPNNTHTVKALPPTSWHLTTVFLFLRFARLVAVHAGACAARGYAACAARDGTATAQAGLRYTCAAGTGAYATPLPPLLELLGFSS